jgi:hypothetical protein
MNTNCEIIFATSFRLSPNSLSSCHYSDPIPRSTGCVDIYSPIIFCRCDAIVYFRASSYWLDRKGLRTGPHQTPINMYTVGEAGTLPNCRKPNPTTLQSTTDSNRPSNTHGTDPEGSRRSRIPDFKTFGTWRWQGCQPHAPAAFTSRKYSWYSFLLEAESTLGPQCGRKDYVNEKFQWHHRESNPRPSGL